MNCFFFSASVNFFNCILRAEFIDVEGQNVWETVLAFVKTKIMSLNYLDAMQRFAAFGASSKYNVDRLIIFMTCHFA